MYGTNFRDVMDTAFFNYWLALWMRPVTFTR